MQYNLNDFNKIQMQGFSYELDNSTLEIIQNIAKLVGDIGYIKTPNFEKKKNNYKKKRKHINDDEWKIMRDFKVTTIEKKEGIEDVINRLRGHINKISKNTYDKEYNNVLELLVNNNVESNEMNMNRVVNSIYDTITKNTFNSDLYAKLYSELSKKYKIVEKKIDSEFYELFKLPNTIEYFDPNTDYDKFCDNNKENERKKSTIEFYANLSLNENITSENLFKLLEHYVELLTEKNLDDVKMKHQNEQLAEWIYLLITKCYELLEDDDDWEDLLSQIENVSECKSKDHNGLTNKIIFKFMDIIEFIEENE